MGFKAYEVWALDLRDTVFYETCDDEQIARRFSVNQFCTMSLYDARKAAYDYLFNSCSIIDDELLPKIADCFEQIAKIAADLHHMLDSGMALDGIQSRQFWTVDKRNKQADALDEMSRLEREAYVYSKAFISQQKPIS